MRQKYGLGIDAGGTYTDVVILDFATGKVVGSSKALTTKPDPSEGISNALAQMNEDLLTEMSMVSLATTFATNAIVEDQGAEAGLILVGYNERPPEIPRNNKVLMVEGGHTVTGEEKVSLDLGGIEERLETFLEGLDGVAVAAFFSVRNPEHEVRVAQLIREKYNLPVVQGHQLSMRLDVIKRATTAWWNARLIPLISNLIRATIKVLSERGIRAPLMVVRGDGTLMSVQTALDRPVETLLSGPAASILGAKHLSGLSDALIVDMGGTTTDIAALSNGKVSIDPQGAQVGRWKTHVEAARIRTVGLGGDSLISMKEGGELSVGPRRVVPLCVSAERVPEILGLLKKISLSASKLTSMNVNPCSIYIRMDERPSGERRELPGYFESGPVSEFLLFRDVRQWSSTWDLENFERQGLVFRSALTPTDLRVAFGKFELGNPEAATLGLSVFAKHLDMEVSSFAQAVEEEISKKLCLETITYLSENKYGDLSHLVGHLSQQPSMRTNGVGLDVHITLTAPVIGVGAPVEAWLPMAFHRLHTECILPEAYEVAVAVGALVGMVDRTITAKIRPNDSGRYNLHTDVGRENFNTLEEAVNQGRRLLEELARKRMRRDHVVEPLLEFAVEERKAKTTQGQEIHLETELRLRATGRPNVSKQG